MYDNLPPGYGATLAYLEDCERRWEYAMDRAWDLLADEAPDGIGWRFNLEDVWSDERHQWVICFYDDTGLEYEARVSEYSSDDEGDWL